MAEKKNRFKKDPVEPNNPAILTRAGIVTPEPAPSPVERVQIEIKQESKQEGKTCGFYLSYEAIDLLDDFARTNRCSKSKALDTLILQVLGK